MFQIIYITTFVYFIAEILYMCKYINVYDCHEMFVETTLSVVNLKTCFVLRKRTNIMRLIANSLRLIGFEEVRYIHDTFKSAVQLRKNRS